MIPYGERHKALADAVLASDDAREMLKAAGYRGRHTSTPWVQVYYEDAQEAASPKPKLISVDGALLVALAGADEATADGAVYEHDQKALLERAMIAALTPRQERVLRLAFFHDATLQEIGDLIGITGARARQIEIVALNKLKKWFAREGAILPAFASDSLVDRARDALSRKKAREVTPSPRPAPSAPPTRTHWALGYGAAVTIKDTDINFSDVPGLVLRIGETWAMNRHLADKIVANGHGVYRVHPFV